MNKKLQDLLIELKLDIKLERLLEYIDGNLDFEESLKIKKIIASNTKLSKLIHETTRLITKPDFSIPSKRIHNSLINRLELNKKSIMDISISLLKNSLNIISGKKYLLFDKTNLAFRSNSRTELNFNNDLVNYNINCFCNYIDSKNLSLHFKIKSLDHTPLKNVQFQILLNNKNFRSLLTDSEGFTKSTTIKKGKYNVTIIKKKVLGNINLEIS